MSIQPAAMRRLMRELAELQKSPPEGIRVQTSEDNILDVVGIIQGPEGTPYEGGYFRVKFRFTEEFPSSPPKCTLLTKIFHPNVSGAGEICVNTLKKDWKPTYGIGHILVTIKCLLIYPNPESALDEEAGKLLLEDYEAYCSRAKLITSVHATPKTRPVEFDTPSVPSAEEDTTVAPKITHKPTSVSSTTPVFTLPMPTRKASATSSPSPTIPLKSSPSNLSVDKESGATKERHTSPSPLATADANIASKTMNVVPAAPAPKSMKRSAAATGAEKRKKALKRL